MNDAGADATVPDAPGWTACSSPSGQRICYGPNHCPKDQACGACENNLKMPDTTTLGVCLNSPGALPTFCWWAPDGKVCVSEIPDKQLAWSPGVGDFELGLLFLKNGAGDRVRYADWGLFDGTPLPEPATCPMLKSARICGGNCGGCETGEYCHGRSPLHPYGFCVGNLTGNCLIQSPCKDTSLGCFIFTVQPEAQPLADKGGLCVPKAVCQELATSAYPGGGSCVF